MIYHEFTKTKPPQMVLHFTVSTAVSMATLPFLDPSQPRSRILTLELGPLTSKQPTSTSL